MLTRLEKFAGHLFSVIVQKIDAKDLDDDEAADLSAQYAVRWASRLCDHIDRAAERPAITFSGSFNDGLHAIADHLRPQAQKLSRELIGTLPESLRVAIAHEMGLDCNSVEWEQRFEAAIVRKVLDVVSTGQREFAGEAERSAANEGLDGITTEERRRLSAVLAAARAMRPAKFYGHHCGFCGVYVGYYAVGEGLAFDSRCGCSNLSSPRNVPLSELLKFLRMNPDLPLPGAKGTIDDV